MKTYEKHILFISVLIYLNLFTLQNSYSQTQTVGRINISSNTNFVNTTKIQLAPHLKDSAKKINQSISNYVHKPNAEKLFLLRNMLTGISFLNLLPKGDSIKSKVDSAFHNDSVKINSNDTIPIEQITGTDSTNNAGNNSQDTTSTGCNNLGKINDMVEEKQNDGSYLFSILDEKDNPLTTFIIKQFDEALFNKKVNDAVNNICGHTLDATDTAKASKIIKSMLSKNLYTRFLEASLEVDNSQDLAGIMSINKHVLSNNKITKSYTDTTNLAKIDSVKHLNESLLKKMIKDSAKVIPKDTIIKSSFTVYSIQIQFQDGFIENIKIFGKNENDSNLLKFENAYPIPFSTRKNFKILYKVNLYEKSIYQDQIMYLCLGDVLSYNQMLALDSKDYSPANQVYTNEKVTDSITDINLYKEQTSKILEVKIYSDLKGINNDNPNGLIQFELSKKLNFWTTRYRFGRKAWFNYGFLNYIVPQFSMTKIENNQKRLALNYLDTVAATDNPNRPIIYTSTINLLKHQSFNVGFDLSLALADVPGLKSTFNLGTFFYYGNTPVQDTIRNKQTLNNHTSFVADTTNNLNDYDVTTFQWGALATWQIFPNARYGINITGRIYAKYKSLNSQFLQVRDSTNYVNFIQAANGDATKYDLYSFRKILVSTEIFAFFKPSDYSKLFFRYRFTHDKNNVRANFRQLQVGFSTYLTKTKEVDKAKTSDTPNL